MTKEPKNARTGGCGPTDEAVQPINEKLEALNLLLLENNRRLARANSDLKNLLESTEIATVFLDRDDRVRLYTPAAGRLFDMPEDANGHSIHEIPSHLEYPQLREDIAQLKRDQKLITREVHAPSRQQVLMARLSPYRSEEGQTDGSVLSFIDVTDQVKALHEADRARQRLQTLQDSLAAFVGMLSPDGTLIQANETALAAAGLRPEDVIGKKFWDAYWWNWDSATQDRLKESVARAAKGETVRYDAEVQVEHGQHIIIDFQLVPVVEEDGSVSAIIPSAIDITQRLEAEQQLRETLAQHQAFFENAPVGLAMLDLDRRWIRVNPAFARLFGVPVSDHIGKRPDEIVPGVNLHPDPVGEIRRTGEPIIGYELATKTLAFPDEERHLSHNYFPIYVGGELRAIGKSVRDVTDERKAEERQALLIAELQHRVKNILATVQSVARFTARHSDDKDKMVASLQSRLAAIARTHDGLTREQWSGQWLKTLIRNEVMPYDDEASGRVSISGDDVLLRSSQAMSFGLALHELATNAAKYGALSVSGGRLSIEIETDRRGGLRRMTWTEQDGPPIEAPSREGFGSFLLDKVLGAELGAKVTSEFRPEGLCVTIDVASKTS